MDTMCPGGKMTIELSPTERLITMSLALNPHQTPEQLQQSTGTKTAKHLARAIHTLRLAGLIEASNGQLVTYRLAPNPGDAFPQVSFPASQ
jgi:hypothetical protein